ncbi:MAG: hypothetical protein D6681_15115, partial [Calditrichaeota bacterium]
MKYIHGHVLSRMASTALIALTVALLWQCDHPRPAGLKAHYRLLFAEGKLSEAQALVRRHPMRFRRIFQEFLQEGLRFQAQKALPEADRHMAMAREIAHTFAAAWGDSFLVREYRFCEALKDTALQKKLTADSLFLVGYRFYREGKIEEARKHYRQSLQLCREIGDRKREVDNLIQMQYTLYREDRNREALAMGEEILTLSQQLGYRQQEAW